MKDHFLKADSAQQFTIPGGSEGVLYDPHPEKEQSVARVKMDGRYPETGYAINEICTETIYLLEGELTLTYGEEQYVLKPGDLFYVLPGTRYALEGKGESMVFITPAWQSEQNSFINEAGETIPK